MSHASEPGLHDTAATNRFCFAIGMFARSTRVFAWSWRCGAGDVVSGGNGCQRWVASRTEVIEVDSLADNLTRVNRTNHFVESGVTMAPGHHGDPKKPPRMLSPSNVLRRCVPCEKVRRKGSGKIGRKVGFCGGGVGPRLARRLALTRPRTMSHASEPLARHGNH